MFNKLFFTLITSITIANHSANAMLEFKEGHPAELAVSRIKEMRGSDVFLAESEDKSASRRFQLICQDQSITRLDQIQEDTVIKGIWSSFENGWLFKYVFMTEGNQPIFIEKNKVSGILFTIKEIK